MGRLIRIFIKVIIILCFFVFLISCDDSQLLDYLEGLNEEEEELNPTYMVTYNGNGNTGGTVPTDSNNYEEGAKVTVLGNPGNLTRTIYTFTGWNTSADGSGTTYGQEAIFTIGATNVVLYARWSDEPTYTVTYNGNGNTNGTVPVDSTNYEEGFTVTTLSTTYSFAKINISGDSYRFWKWNTQADGNGIDYNNGATFTMGTGNVTLYAKWIPYALRDTGPAGGLIFYDNGDYSEGWRYLEAAPNDQSNGVIWGCRGTDVPGAGGTIIGIGEQNTIDILSGCSTSGTAADICANLSLGGYNDWFLPSLDELNEMYTELHLLDVGGFAGETPDEFYWTSSEYNNNFAYCLDFYNGSQKYNGNKNNSLRVRAVRAF
jgi:hypothetical protein